jgi:hypothetical protein
VDQGEVEMKAWEKAFRQTREELKRLWLLQENRVAFGYGPEMYFNSETERMIKEIKEKDKS